jgi:hypothetical protein
LPSHFHGFLKLRDGPVVQVLRIFRGSAAVLWRRSVPPRKSWKL